MLPRQTPLAQGPDDRVSAEPAPADDLPRNVPGLDIEQGLHNLMGKRALYLTVLRLVLRDQSKMVPATRQALSESDFDTAERLAHTLKGTASTVAAFEVRDAAARLEQLCRRLKQGQSAEWAPVLDDLRACLDPMLQGLRDFLEPTPPSAAAD